MARPPWERGCRDRLRCVRVRQIRQDAADLPARGQRKMANERPPSPSSGADPPSPVRVMPARLSSHPGRERALVERRGHETSGRGLLARQSADSMGDTHLPRGLAEARPAAEGRGPQVAGPGHRPERLPQGPEAVEAAAGQKQLRGGGRRMAGQARAQLVHGARTSDRARACAQRSFPASARGRSQKSRRPSSSPRSLIRRRSARCCGCWSATRTPCPCAAPGPAGVRAARRVAPPLRLPERALPAPLQWLPSSWFLSCSTCEGSEHGARARSARTSRWAGGAWTRPDSHSRHSMPFSRYHRTAEPDAVYRQEGQIVQS